MGSLFGKTVSLKLSTRLHESVRQVDCGFYRMLQHSKIALTNQDTSCLRSGQQEAVSAVAFGLAKFPFDTWLRTCRLIASTAWERRKQLLANVSLESFGILCL